MTSRSHKVSTCLILFLTALPHLLSRTATGQGRLTIDGEATTAIVSRVMGEVEIAVASSPTGFAMVHESWVLKQGSVLRLAEGASILMICSTNHLLRLDGSRSTWTLTEEACTSAPQLPPGSFDALAKDFTTITAVRGGLVAQADTRRTTADEAILLEPRNTAVLESRPKFRFRMIPTAHQYGLTLTGLTEPIWYDAANVTCSSKSRTCEVLFPDSHPGLQEGITYDVAIQYREKPFGIPLSENKTTTIRRLPSANDACVRYLGRALRAIELSPAEQAMVVSQLQAGQGLFSAAADDLETELTRRFEPQLGLRASEVYLAMNLPDRAEEILGNILSHEATGMKEVARSREYLGLIYYSRRDFVQAEHELRTAAGLFRRLGWLEQAESAELLAAQARSKIGEEPEF